MAANFSYHFLPADFSIEAVAVRFRTTKAAIFEATRDAVAFTGKAAIDVGDSSSWRPSYNDFVVVPIPADHIPEGVEWREVPSTNRPQTTFKALLDSLAKGGDGKLLGVSNTNVECEDIYHDWRNRDYREAASLRLKSGAANDLVLPGVVAASTEAGYDIADILPEDKIYVPIERQFAFMFPAAPSADAKSAAPPATVDVGTNDLRELQTRLRAIDLACYNLAGIRRRAQQIQAECNKDLRTLAMARTLVQVVTKCYATEARVNAAGREADEGRRRLLKALDELIAKASNCMLNAPQKKVDPKLGVRWTQVLTYLESLLKDPPTLALLDRLLPTHGDLPFKQDGADKRTLVDALCETASHAALWLADGPVSESCADLFAAAISAMKSGSAPSLSGATSILDYAASLSFAVEPHPAVGRTSPVAACSVIVSAYTSGILMDSAAAGDGNERIARAEKDLGAVVKTLLLQKALSRLGQSTAPSLSAYLALTGELFHVDEGRPTAVAELAKQQKEVREKATLASEMVTAATRRHVENAISLSAADQEQEAWKELGRALKAGDKKVHDIYKEIEAFEDPQKEFRSLPGRVNQISGVLKLVYSIAYGTETGKTETKKDREEAVQTVLDSTRETFEALKKIGVLTEASEELTTAVLGRASLVLGVIFEGDAAVAAVQERDYLSAAAHALQSVGQLFLVLGPETGGTTVVIGVVLIAAGVVLDSPKTLKELVTSHSEILFNEYFDRFKKGNAAHFQADLGVFIEKVDAMMNREGAAELPPLNEWDLEAYGGDLYKAGFARDEF